MFNKNQIFLIIILLSCIGSRILTSIYYIEDIDSLRFALSIYEYDIIKLQPHFPGYPIFSFIAKCLYFILGNMGVTFSIIGGISVFNIIYFLLRISKLSPLSTSGLFLIFIIFFNPLVWLMSNRYMPDLFGLSIFISALYFFISDIKDRKFLYLGYFLTGLLAGIRLSYLPLLIIPFMIPVFWASYQFLTKLISTNREPFVAVFYSGIVGSIVFSLYTYMHWVSFNSNFVWLQLFVLGAIGFISHLILVYAIQLSNLSFVANFQYSQLVWSSIIGYLIFGTYIETSRLLGIAAIIVFGILFIKFELSKKLN